MNILSTHNLKRQFGKHTAVKSVSMNLEKGDIYGFVGPNGAGKTTVLKMITGLIEPTEGTISCDHKTMSAVIETPQFYNHMSGRDNLKIIAMHYGKHAENRVDEVLKITELQDAAHKKVGAYSLGMKQRLGLARAFISDPEIIILDEPTNGLDPYGIRAMRDLIMKLARQYNKTFIVSSHILTELELMCNKVGIIHNGILLEETPMNELKSRLQNQTFEDYFLTVTEEGRRYA